MPDFIVNDLTASRTGARGLRHTNSVACLPRRTERRPARFERAPVICHVPTKVKTTGTLGSRACRASARRWLPSTIHALPSWKTPSSTGGRERPAFRAFVTSRRRARDWTTGRRLVSSVAGTSTAVVQYDPSRPACTLPYLCNGLPSVSSGGSPRYLLNPARALEARRRVDGLLVRISSISTAISRRVFGTGSMLPCGNSDGARRTRPGLEPLRDVRPGGERFVEQSEGDAG